MVANNSPEETGLVDGAVAWLREHIPTNWEVARANRTIAGPNLSEPQTLGEAVIELRSANSTYATFAVEARRSFSPRDVERLLPGLTRLLRTLAGNVPVLVVAPWLSARTQELLRREGINYIDITGNARVQLDNPAVYISATGETRNPDPAERGRARVRGPKAARLVRLLIDVRPPYGVREIASATDLAPGYVSRLLDALDREALVGRSRKGEVESVDVPGLVKRWAESYDVLKSNEAQKFIAPNGASKALQILSEEASPTQLAITGSFAAVRIAPVAAPALLLAYCEDPAPIVDRLGLLPADAGGNVILLRPFDRVVWERTSTDGGLTYVAPSQTAVDCLTGTGRMPSEGEAVLAWMVENESEWRLESLRDLVAGGERK